MANKYIYENLKNFEPEHIFECGQVFRWRPIADSKETLDTNKYAKTIQNAERISYIGAAGSYIAMIDWDGASLAITSSGGSKEFWYDYFDLDTDYGAIKGELIKNDGRIKEACEHGYGIRILNQDLFETIISFIISQNNNIPRIRKCIESICEKYGEPVSSDDVLMGSDKHIMFSFPAPEALAKARVEDLMELKLGYRSSYIVESANSYVKNGAPKSYDELLNMHGIGPKVANCIMLFGMKDVEAFPIDTWVKHIMNDMYGFDESDTTGMKEFARRKFGKYAGYAQQYLFYYYRDKKK